MMKPRFLGKRLEMKLGDMRLRLGGLGMRPGGLKLRLGGLGMRLRKESTISLHSPSFIMGSIVNVCPGFITPIALFSGRANQSTNSHISQPQEREARCILRVHLLA